jgi:cytochrome P450
LGDSFCSRGLYYEPERVQWLRQASHPNSEIGHTQKKALDLNLDIFAPESLADPYPLYRRLQTEAPRLWHEGRGHWIFTRHADVAALLAHPGVGAEKFNADWLSPPLQAEFGPLYRMLARQMLFMDPPRQTRLRSLAAKAFTPRVIEGIRTQIQSWTDTFLDAAPKDRTLDIIRDLAYPLPATIIAELLGIPPEDRDRFKKGSDDFAGFLGAFSGDVAEVRSFLPSIYWLMDYLGEIVDRTRAHPGDNLLSELVAVEEQGDRLTEDELIANCLLLLAAGHETTTNLIGNGLYALLSHPMQAETLRRDPAGLPVAVEELLRYDSPIQWTTRYANETIVLGDTRLEAGQFLMLGLGAANHDPAQFTDPNRLDISRQEGRHLAFGYGVHYCLGSALARLEGQIALGTLLRRFPALRLTGEPPHRRPNLVFRALESLVVET